MDRLFSASMLDASVASTATSATSRAAALNRRNTTSTMHVTDTMAKPDTKLIIEEVAFKVWQHVRGGERERVAVEATADGMKKLRIGRSTTPPVPGAAASGDSENAPPSRQAAAAELDRAGSLLEQPSPSAVADFMLNIFVRAQCSADCAIVCLIYIERLIVRTRLTMTPRNWRSLVATGMLLAGKVWDDLSMINVDFAVILEDLPNFNVNQINKWEFQFLKGMDYDVRVPASEYARRYFDMREAAALRTGQIFEDTNAPLSTERAQHLEALSSVTQKRVDEMRAGRPSHRKAVSDQHLAPDGHALPAAPAAPKRAGVSVMD